MRVLLVDNDPMMARTMALLLKPIGAMVSCVASGAEALDVLLREDFDVAAIDLMLPDMDGYELLCHMRETGSDVPVLILSGLVRSEAKVRAFSCGADDFVCKPFDREELVARVQALARRYKESPASLLTLGDVTINSDNNEVFVGATQVPLTSKEFATLELLAKRRGTVLAKSAILDHLYGGVDEPDAKIVDVFICKLRRKLGQAGAPDLIGTEWGRGYIIRHPARAETPARARPVAMAVAAMS